MNVLSLLFLLYFIFAVLAVFIFKDSPFHEAVSNSNVNFDNFINALVVLFRCSTGEDWHVFMYHYSEAMTYPILGIFYFLLYILLSSFVMLNMFTLVVKQQFEEIYINPENPITCFKELAEQFRICWAIFSWKYSGTKIKERNLIEFFSILKTPLGYRYIADDQDGDDLNTLQDGFVDTLITKEKLAKEIFFMDLPVDEKGFVPFAAVLHAACKNAYGMNYLKKVTKQSYNVIRRQEVLAMAEIYLRHVKQEGLSFYYRKANPILDLLYCK